MVPIHVQCIYDVGGYMNALFACVYMYVRVHVCMRMYTWVRPYHNDIHCVCTCICECTHTTMNIYTSLHTLYSLQHWYSWIINFIKLKWVQTYSIVHSGYVTLFGVHELHGWMYPKQGRVINLFAVDPLSLFGYLTVNPTHPVTDN